MEDLPYKAEYAKSGRSNCRSCKTSIGQGTLRLAVMVQSPMFDGKTPNWYHNSCFFKKQRPKSTDDIAHFEGIRWADQQEIKSNISSITDIIVPAKKGKKRDTATVVGLQDYTLEYSKSSRAMCRGCEIKIMKDEVRIAKKDYETEHGMRYGGQDMWHHLTCFAKLRAELGYFECGDKLPGYKSLKKDDQKEVVKNLPAIKQEDVPDAKKFKKEDEAPDGFDKILEKQSKEMFKMRDQLQKNLKKTEMQKLLEENDQDIPAGVDRILDRLSDMMVFGCLLSCPVCKTGQFKATRDGYVCTGDLTEWTKCENKTKDPKRTAVTISSDFAIDHAFLKKYKYKYRCRVFRDTPVVAKTEVKKEENGQSSGPRVRRDKPPLYNMLFNIMGRTNRGKDVLKKEIIRLGGQVTTSRDRNVMAVIANPSDVENMNVRMQDVKQNGVHVVPETFIDEVAKYTGKIAELLQKVTICDWGIDPSIRVPPIPTTSSGATSSSGARSRSMFTSSMPSKQKLKLKGGTAVDPDSRLEETAHVYIDSDGVKYTTVLGLTDIQRQKNSFYKLQVLEADRGGQCWLFRSWGRIGTTIGGNKVEEHSAIHSAVRQFCDLFQEKSGNDWDQRECFEKMPRCMYPIDVDYGEDDSKKLDIKDDHDSKLPKEVQDLIKLIFNVDNMKNLMLEFELDMEKMPLGKLSKQQIKMAYEVLTELQELITKSESNSKFIDASNRFYTFIPHTFGIDAPTIIKDSELIKQKIEMLDNLLELEIAYSLMKSTGGTGSVDTHYEKLNTDLGVLSKDSDEFKILEKYVQNTHGATHTQYNLEILNVFTVKRKGEEKRFKPFKKMHNRQLLWHGSRTTNFAGILSQGLRIAPPEAPVTGYMFGKGIYFADMVTKSANYCATSPQNNTGLLLLCDVALGDMYELENSKYIEKLPKGKHSCKGVGRTEPNESESVPLLNTGAVVPLGKPKTNAGKDTVLLYNEYIVYDVAQVNAKYLIEMDFKYGY